MTASPLLHMLGCMVFGVAMLIAMSVIGHALGDLFRVDEDEA